jgi:hypothetical protein
VALKNIPAPEFADDDGSADPGLAAALAAYAEDSAAAPQVLEALAGTRLLVPVVAVLGEVEEGPDGLRREKTSEMGAPILSGPGGRRALPAFTCTESMARWDPKARPVAVHMHEALKSAVREEADTVVLDMAGPVPYELRGAELIALAEGRRSTDPLADPAVAGAVRSVLAGERGVVRAHLAPGGDADGILALVLAPEAEAREVLRRVTTALAGDEVLRARLVRGLDLALLPAKTTIPGESLLSRQA